MVKILLVDDETNILKLSSFIIKSLGYQVYTAEDGSKALAFLAENPNIDLVISDLLMPEVGGFELCQKIGARYPVVIVSAMFEEFKGDTVFKTQAIDYIPKPFDINYVRQRLAVILYKLGLNPQFTPKISVQLAGQPLYQAENVLVLNHKSDSLAGNDLPKLSYAEPADFNLENIIKESEIIGQTIQRKQGGLRIVKNIDLEKQLSLLKVLNRTNLALGDVTGIFFTEHRPSAELSAVFDRVIA